MSIDDLFRRLSAQNTEILHRLTTAFSGLREFETETESDPVNQMNTFQGYLNVLGDSQSKDESKLKAAQELNESFDVILAHSQYQTFLDCHKGLHQILTGGHPSYQSRVTHSASEKVGFGDDSETPCESSVETTR